MSSQTKKLNKNGLQQQSFDFDQPGPILANIQAMIAAIGQGIPTSSPLYRLPIACLSDLNERLTTPLVHRLKRPQLRSFPTLAGLFLLLRASGLAVGEPKPQRIVMIDPERLSDWESLNATEKYMSLIDVCWKKCSLTILDDWDDSEKALPLKISEVFESFIEAITYFDPGVYHSDCDHLSRVAMSLLEQFGWIKVEYSTEIGTGKTAEIRTIEKTEFGKAMYSLLCPSNRYTSIVSDHNPTSVEEKLKPYFPKWQRSLSRPEATFRSGRYTLKMSWGDVWRRLEFPAQCTLDDVCALTLFAFKFDNDHLHQFVLRDSYGKKVLVCDPRIRDADYFSDEIQLGGLNLSEGETFTLRYDFGDEWNFEILVESIDDSVTKDFKPKIIAKRGTAPKQYDRQHFEW